MTPAILTTNLTKIYRRQVGLRQLLSGRGGPEVLAVNGISLAVRPGEVFGVLGPNGAGKTTFIKLLCTLLLPSSGHAALFGHDVVREAQAVKRLVGLVTSEERSFFWRLTGRQNLRFFAAMYQLPRTQAARRIEELLALLDLAEAGNARFNEYSTGMRQKLAIARGLLSQPRILFMDEPTRGLDPLAAQTLLRLIRQRVVDELGSTIVLTTHILRDVEQLCDRIALISAGRLTACGTLEELRLVSRRYEKYRLRVRALPERTGEALGRLPGVLSCERASREDGVVEMDLSLHKEVPALSGALRAILAAGGEVLSCTREEEPFESVFTNLLRPAEPAAAGAPGTRPC